MYETIAHMSVTKWKRFFRLQMSFSFGFMRKGSKYKVRKE